MSAPDTLPNDVRAGLRTLLLTLPGLPPVAQRAWENRNFTPPVNPVLEWIRDTLIFAPTNQVSLGPTALRRTKFTYLIDSFLLPDTGTVPEDTRVGKLALVFNEAGIYSYNGLTIHIERSGGYPRPLNDGKWRLVPFTVEGYADVQNVI